MEAHRDNRWAEKKLHELLGDFITRDHTVADLRKLLDLAAGGGGVDKGQVKQARELLSGVLRIWDLPKEMTSIEMTSILTILGQVEALLLNEEER